MQLRLALLASAEAQETVPEAGAVSGPGGAQEMLHVGFVGAFIVSAAEHVLEPPGPPTVKMQFSVPVCPTAKLYGCEPVGNDTDVSPLGIGPVQLRARLVTVPTALHESVLEPGAVIGPGGDQLAEHVGAAALTCTLAAHVEERPLVLFVRVRVQLSAPVCAALKLNPSELVGTVTCRLV